MNENIDIDELLNSFIDGELTERHQNEVKRLITHDAQIAQRLQELQRCKILISSLPRSEAPAGMLEDIKVELERRTLLDQQMGSFEEQYKGVRNLRNRRILSYAAMIALAAVLGSVIYSIIAPERAVEGPGIFSRADKSSQNNMLEKTIPGIVKNAETSSPGKLLEDKMVSGAGLKPRGGRFKARLELKTSEPSVSMAAIKRAVEDNVPAGQWASWIRSNNMELSVLECSRANLILFLANLQDAWAEFGSVKLFVQAGQNKDSTEVEIEAVSPEQILQIANQNSAEDRIKVAKNFAALNNIDRFMPGQEMLGVIDGKKPSLMTIPKPLLTSPEKTVKTSANQQTDDEKVHIVIVVTESNSWENK